MTIQGLGYVGVRAKSLEDWAGFGEKFLGCSSWTRAAAASPSAWTTASSASWSRRTAAKVPPSSAGRSPTPRRVDANAARLEQAGVAVTRGSRALADERRVADLIAFDDPVGNRLEIFHGAEIASEPFKPGRNISGFRTGTLGMGHAVLHVKTIHDVIPFYRDVLGFRLSDYMMRPFNAYFFHANPRHHSVAFIETGRNATHHLMMELYNLDDVGQCYDLALGEEGRIGVTLGRHINDEVTSFYSNTPSGFMVEYGWGGRVIDVDNWQPEEVELGPEHVGPRPHVDAAGRPRRGAQAPHRRRRDGPAQAGQRDRGQSRAHGRRMPLVGRRAQAKRRSNRNSAQYA